MKIKSNKVFISVTRQQTPKTQALYTKNDKATESHRCYAAERSDAPRKYVNRRWA